MNDGSASHLLKSVKSGPQKQTSSKPKVNPEWTQSKPRMDVIFFNSIPQVNPESKPGVQLESVLVLGWV